MQVPLAMKTAWCKAQILLKPQKLSDAPEHQPQKLSAILALQMAQPDPRVRRLVTSLKNTDRLGDNPPPVVLLLNKVIEPGLSFSSKLQSHLCLS